MLKNLLPIRKIAVGLLAYSITLAAHKLLKLDLGADVVNQAADGLVGFAVAYAIKDPRVSGAVDDVVESPFAQVVAAELERLLASDPSLVTRVTRLVAADLAPKPQA